MKTLSELASQLKQPPIDFSPVPFWFLNKDMDRRELERQLHLMREIGLGGVVLHGRQGHTVPYMSNEWLEGIVFCVEVCAALGMKAWLYDEDNWPSGYAGGAVLQRHPEGQAKCLAMVPVAEAEGPVVATIGDMAFVQRHTPWHPAYNPGLYTDLLDPQVTEAFIAATHEPYAQALGDHLGTTVTAVFSDEPGFYNHFYDCAPRTVIWTPDLPEEFERRVGYDLLPHLPELFQPGVNPAEGPRVRRDFYRIVSRLLVERFYLPQKRWCNEHGVQFVGHVNNEELLVDHVRLNADYFSAMDGYDMPGLDIIFIAEDYRRAPDSIVPKLASSAAHTRGKSQALTETYGATGWSLAPAEMRRMADWQLVRGVTRFVPHAFYYSIEGERFHESPPSLFFQSAHWPYIPALMQYITRWTWMLENTRPCGQVAVYYPIDAVRGVTTTEVEPSLGNGLNEDASEAGRLGKQFREVLDRLFRAKVDFDVVDDVALQSAQIADGALRVADLAYRCLVVPPGGASEEAAAIIDGAKAAGVPVLEGEASAILPEAMQWAIARLEPASEQVVVARRRAREGELFLVVNEGQEKYEGTLILPVTGKVTRWDLACGQIDEWDVEACEGETRIAITLLDGAAECFGIRPPGAMLV
jgi:hypothetical protein